MKILITGAEGQVGSEFRVIASKSNHCFVYANKDLLDLRDEKQTFDLIQHVSPDLVINCAAYTAVDNAEENSQAAFAINAKGAQFVGAACASVDAALIHFSTDYVFSGDGDAPFLEDDPSEPVSVYGKSKLAGEQLIASVLTKHIILRTAWVFGASGGNFAKTMLRLGTERDHISVVDDQQGAPTSARGLAECCLRIADKIETQPNRICWGTYHFSGAPYVNWFQFAQAIFREAKKLGLIVVVPDLKAIRTEEFPTIVERPKNSKLNCSKILREFGVLPDPWEGQLHSVLEEIRYIEAREKAAQ